MASRFTIVILACVVAACTAEAPFRGYSSRQQAAPYPAAGYRPERTFNLPTEEAIAQQLRLAQAQKRQRLQQQPSRLYGPPESETQQPSGVYGAPPPPSTNYGTPEEALSQQRARLVRPKQAPARQYAAPEASQPQRQLSRQYGPPAEPTTTPVPETSAESLEESKEVETVAAVANSIDNKPGRLTEGQRDTENDEAETTTTPTAAAAPVQPLYLLPVAGFAPQKLAFLQAAPLAKLQLPGVYAAQPQKLVAAPQVAAPQLAAPQIAAPQLAAPQFAAPQFLAAQGYYQPQQLAFAPQLQAW